MSSISIAACWLQSNLWLMIAPAACLQSNMAQGGSACFVMDQGTPLLALRCPIWRDRSKDGAIPRRQRAAPCLTWRRHSSLIVDQTYQDGPSAAIPDDHFPARRPVCPLPFASIGDRWPLNADHRSRLHCVGWASRRARRKAGNEEKHRSALRMNAPTPPLSVAPEWMSSRKNHPKRL